MAKRVSQRASRAPLDEAVSPVTVEALPDPVRLILSRYTESLLRQVADRLLKSRLQRSAEELMGKMGEALANAAVVDRRLRDLEEPARMLLALIGLSRQPRWRLGGLLELLSAFEVPDGMAVVFDLLEAGLLFPEMPEERSRLRNFEEWLGRASATAYRIFAHPLGTARALSRGLNLAPLQEPCTETKEIREADGLDFFLRLGVLWQRVKAAPLRLTQQGQFFKKDHERLIDDSLLTGPSGEELTPLPHPGYLILSLGLGCGLFREEEAQIVAGEFPACWQDGLPAALNQLWATFGQLESWDAAQGWRGLYAGGSPYGSASVLALALLAHLEETEWAEPQAISAWLQEHHCYWKGSKPGSLGAGLGDEVDVETSPRPRQSLAEWVQRFLLGIAYSLRLVQAAKDADDRWVVRLTSLGRSILGLVPAAVPPAFPKALLVQPNLEIVAYRQGVTPALIAALSRFATWKTLGPVCTLQLDSPSIYRGLETGFTLEQILQTLQQHGVREMPASAMQLLQTWADKRERLTVYSAATLLEFNTPEEMQAALGRGLSGTPISDRLILVPDEQTIDFRHFRLVGTRDYGLRPDQCVEVASDGVTLTVDVARADLLLETELQRFAEPLANSAPEGRRFYRLTPASLGRSRESGWSLGSIEEWFTLRAGQPLPPAVRMLLSGPDLPPLTIKRLVVVEVPSPLVADGLLQWPETRDLIQARLGPQHLAVAEHHLEALRVKVGELRITLHSHKE